MQWNVCKLPVLLYYDYDPNACMHIEVIRWVSNVISPWLNRQNTLFEFHERTWNRPFYRYGSHFEFYCFKSYYGMLRGQISMYLPPEHPIIDIWNNGIQNGRRIGKKVYWITDDEITGLLEMMLDKDWKSKIISNNMRD